MNKTFSIVLYDDKCGFCTSIAKYLKKKDTKNYIRWISNDSNTGKELLLKRNLEEHVDSIIYIDEEKHLVKSDAIVEILKIVNYKVRFLIQLFPTSFCNFIYDKISENRYLFNRCEVDKTSENN